MNKKKNIVYINYGDSYDPKTWSNVAYLFGKELENKYNVTRVDIGHKRNVLSILYTSYFKIFHRKSTYYYANSKHNHNRIDKNFKDIVKKYDKTTDLYIICQYKYNLKKFTNKKVLLFSDWPIDFYIEKRLNRKPDKYELKDIEYYHDTIKSSDYVVTLLDDCKKYIDKNYNIKSYYLGNVINCFKESKEFNNSKSDRKFITFIGKITYIDSCIELIKAFDKLNNKDYELHIIGVLYNNFSKDIRNIIDNNKKIIFHGYLDKGNNIKCDEYYDVVKNSLVVVNTHPNWGGLSSILECMYCYRPIITSKYYDFENLFSKKINFGYYSENNEKLILDKLNKIISMNEESYNKLCSNAHKNTENYTYHNYIDKIDDIVFNKKK